MINIVTIHWLSAQWIDPQLDYLERNISSPFRVFASLNGPEALGARGRFHFAEDLPGGHASKLNALAQQVAKESEPTDVIMFLDGDAFPVQPLDTWVGQTLADHPLAAVRRTENAGDLRPHPCFCMTTVGFWQAIGGDWRPGPWTNPEGEEFVDAGTNLYKTLLERSIDWKPMLRTNTQDLHPLWFAIYDHRIYHHGAGFRSRFSYADAANVRVDARNARTWKGPPTLGALAKSSLKDPTILTSLRPRHASTIGRSAVKTARRFAMRRYARRAETTASTVFGRLTSDPGFFSELDEAIGR
jgi:hypothetical protein